jgi:iron complex transport system substrate-binding protein
MRPLAVLLFAAVPLTGLQAEPQRIVTAGAAVTEIVCALGAGDRIVAVDTSSQRVPEVRGKPDIGYVRTLGAEGVLSQKPDLVLVSDEAGPPPVLEQIRAAGTPLVVVAGEKSLEGVAARIQTVAQTLGREEEGASLVTRANSELAALQKVVLSHPEKPTVIFLHARGGNNLMAAGTNTAAHTMIEACGARNACAGFEGYKPLSAEAFAALAPDGVIVSESIVATDAELISSVPGLAATPAGRNGRVIRVDDAAFLGFGPRSASAALQVAARFSNP